MNIPVNWTQNVVFKWISIKPFSKQSGPNLPENFDVTTAAPKVYFGLFFTEEVFATIYTNSNLYHKHYVELKHVLNPQYQDKSWSDIKLNQLKCYFGISIIMGINKLGRYQQYWSSDPYLGNEGVKKCMPIKEYEKIQSNLHISNRDQEPRWDTPNYHKLGKVRWLIESFSQSFMQYNNPQRQSIDEGKLFTIYNVHSPIEIITTITIDMF